MNVDKTNKFGSINISLDAIASVAVNAAVHCYGVIDVTKGDKNSKGINIKKNKQDAYEIDLFIVVAYGVRITEVVAEVQKKVKYDLEQQFKIKFKAINVFVQGIKNI